jgi:hypothetical protein
MNDKFSIDADLLGIVIWLSKSKGMGGDVWFLREIHEQIKPIHQGNYIVAQAFEYLPPSKRKALLDYVLRNATLSSPDERYLRDIGFLYGEVPELPKLVIKRIKEVYSHE